MGQSDIRYAYESSLLRNILANASIGIVETGLDFRIRLANREGQRLFLDGGEIVGLSIRELIREKEALDDVATRLRSEQIARYEGKWTPAETKNHTQFKVILTLSRDDRFVIAGYLLMCEEVVFHRVCCMCGRAETDEGWIPVEELFNRIVSLSHTYCPNCMPKALERVEKLIEEQSQ